MDSARGLDMMRCYGGGGGDGDGGGNSSDEVDLFSLKLAIGLG